MTKLRFDGQIFHFTAVRLRAVGEGNLDLSLNSLDDVFSNILTPLVLAETNNRLPTQLANFNQQRAKVRVSTDEIDEWFSISQIIVFIKPVATSFPG